MPEQNITSWCLGNSQLMFSGQWTLELQISMTLNPAEWQWEDPIPGLLPQGWPQCHTSVLPVDTPARSSPSLPLLYRPFLFIRWCLHLNIFKTCLKVTSHIVLEATLFQYNIILTKDPIPNEDLLSYKMPGNWGMPSNGIQAVTVASQVQTRNLPAFLSLYWGNIKPNSTSLSGNKKWRGSEN